MPFLICDVSPDYRLKITAPQEGGVLSPSKLYNPQGFVSIPDWGWNNDRIFLINGTLKLQISNYHFSNDYDIAVNLGTVSRVEDEVTITFTTPGEGIFYFEGEPVFYYTVVAGAPDAPTITSPVTGATNLSYASITVLSSVFHSGNPYASHKKTHWQASTSPTFDTIAKELVTSNATQLKQWIITGLTPNTKYYLRVRYGDNDNDVA